MKENLKTPLELPSISFSRSRYCGDMIVDNIDVSISAETSNRCKSQFKDLLKILDEQSQKELEESKKRGLIKDGR